MKFFLHREDAENAEKALLLKFKHLKYTGDSILLSGKTGLFKKDILKDKTTWWKHNYISTDHEVRLELL